MRKFIGDKKFYRLLFAIVMPIVLQQFITQFVSLLDNLMVGQVGSSEMTGVSLQIKFYLYLILVFLVAYQEHLFLLPSILELKIKKDIKKHFVLNG